MKPQKCTKCKTAVAMVKSQRHAGLCYRCGMYPVEREQWRKWQAKQKAQDAARDEANRGKAVDK